MGCFISCFRVREEDRSRRSQPKRRQENVLSRDPLSSDFRFEDNLHGYQRMANETEETPSKSQEFHPLYTTDEVLIDESFLQHAEFLKACGTIQETPAEIRKAMKMLMVLPPIKPFKQPEVPPTPLEFCRNSAEDVDSLDHTHCSCISDVQDRADSSVGSSEVTAQGINGMPPKHPQVDTDTATTPFLHRAPASDAPSRAKSVRFETNTAVTYSTRTAKNNLFLEDEAASKPSPYPTPLKLSDEMQTPGTDFAVNRENCFYGKSSVRCQYVYPNPIQNLSHRKDLKKECKIRDFNGQLEDTTQKPESGVEASYSSWLNPHQDEMTDTSYVDFPGGRNELYRTPGERPIIGLVAVHWNEDICDQNPKCWDGNGIPNTTTKYKEDQRVTWHATPFEERLEKALSDERFLSISTRLNC